jgi:hypothetical protein
LGDVSRKQGVKQMTKDMNDLIGIFPTWLQDSFAAHAGTRTAPVTSGGTNHGSLAGWPEQHEHDDEAEPLAPTAAVAFTGKITPGIYSSKGNELSLWMNNGKAEVTISNFSGETYYGALTGALPAEGHFGSAATDEDKAFMGKIFREIIEAARLTRPRPDDRNYTMFATGLWKNRDYSGPCVPRAFLVVTWQEIGGRQVPQYVMLFDGSDERSFKMERQTVTNVRAPQWKGRAA